MAGFYAGFIGAWVFVLKGKILKLSWDGRWNVSIERVNKSFSTYDELRSWLIDILDKVRDPEKKQLLLKDVTNL